MFPWKRLSDGGGGEEPKTKQNKAKTFQSDCLESQTAPSSWKNTTSLWTIIWSSTSKTWQQYPWLPVAAKETQHLFWSLCSQAYIARFRSPWHSAFHLFYKAAALPRKSGCVKYVFVLLKKYFSAKCSKELRFKNDFIHCHPVGELLKGLAIKGDGHPSIGIKGELHTVLDLWFSALLHRSVRIIFVPTCIWDKSESANRGVTVENLQCYFGQHLPDQSQRILSNVDQAPQGFHRLVRRRCHIWKLVQRTAG